MIRSLLTLFFFHIASAHREHKVHNIVLYPEKHSWCKTTAIKEVVGHPGCEAIEVDNNVCVGACFSYSIPRTEPTAPGEVAPYCDSCQPSRVVWKQVTLKCPENENEVMTKRVEIIEDCSCLTCRQVNETQPSARPQSFSSFTIIHEDLSQSDGGDNQSHEAPTILNIMSAPPKAVNSSHIKHGSKLGQLLKMLAGAEDDTADGLDGETTEERLENLIGEMKDKGVNEEELQGLAEKSEATGQVKVDLNKLKELLSKIEGDHEEGFDAEETSLGLRHHLHAHHLPQDPAIHSKESEESLPSPTLDVAPHHLTPTIEGAEISYLTTHHHHHKTED